MQLSNKTALITGASKGIGRELALSLAKEKVNLALIARDQKLLSTLKTECEVFNVKVEIFAADISSESEVEQAYNYFKSNCNSIDILINNAGTGVFKPFEQLTAHDFDTMMNTNVRGTFLITKKIIPLMKLNKSGHIIMIASDVAKRTFAEGSVYCASKHAQHALADGLRKELRSFGIKVSTIYPGLVDTNFGNSVQGAEYKSDWLKPQNIASAIVNLLSMPDNTTIDELVIHPLSQEY